MSIAVLSVKWRIITYVQIHKMAIGYCDLIAKDLELEPISESQLGIAQKKQPSPQKASNVHSSDFS